MRLIARPSFIRRLLAGLMLAALGGGMAWAQSVQPSTAGGAQPTGEAEVRRLRPLAYAGHPIAQFNLGVMFDFGLGIDQDYAEALKWYRKAAAQGHGTAQFNLGGMYFEGAGVGKDYVRAYMWFTLSAAAGAPGAARNRHLLTTLMTPEQIARATAAARECQQHDFDQCD